MENKKTKLTISGKPKKTFKDFNTPKTQGKKTVGIEKQNYKPALKGDRIKFSESKPISSNFKKGTFIKNNFTFRDCLNDFTVKINNLIISIQIISRRHNQEFFKI